MQQKNCIIQKFFYLDIVLEHYYDIRFRDRFEVLIVDDAMKKKIISS